jgi:hypothetical protein
VIVIACFAGEPVKVEFRTGYVSTDTAGLIELRDRYSDPKPTVLIPTANLLYLIMG